MKTLRLMIKPASSLCNMRCRYCFYHNVSSLRDVTSFGIMKAETVDAVLENVFSELNMGDTVDFLFQGGEPTLAGLPFFREFVKKTEQWKGIPKNFALQTNGLLLDEEWCAFLKENHFLVGVSFDLLRDSHDGARVDVQGQGTYSRVRAVLSRLRKAGVEFNVLCTLTAETARHPEAVWKQILSLDLAYVQFTPCLGDFGGDSRYALTPERFASFYRSIFEYWYAEFQKGGRRSIKLFDDVVNLLLLGVPTSCGMDGVCRPQLVIESDGSAFPCDFYCLDEYKLGNITQMPPTELLRSLRVAEFCNRRPDLWEGCRDCRYRRFCGGGCPRMEKEIYRDGKECGYKAFLDACGGVLSQLAREVRTQQYAKRERG